MIRDTPVQGFRDWATVTCRADVAMLREGRFWGGGTESKIMFLNPRYSWCGICYLRNHAEG